MATLISMVSSFKDKLEQDTQEIVRLSRIIEDLQNHTNSHTSDIEVFRQSTLSDHDAIVNLQKAQDAYNDRVLELWKETSGNTAQIESLKTQVLMLQSERKKN